LKTTAVVLWETLYAPLGSKLLFNYQNLSLEEFQRIVGRAADQARLDAMKETIGDGAMLEFFDGTAPSEKGYIAQSMQDLLLGLLENPQAAMMLSQEPFRSLVVEIADLRGIRSPERFLPPPQIQPPPPENVTQLPTNAGQPNVGGPAAGEPAGAAGTP
jgi:class 3 adenylate cyclase